MLTNEEKIELQRDRYRAVWVSKTLKAVNKELEGWHKYMSNKKSISQRLKQCESLEKRAELIAEWLESWQHEQVALLKRLEQACFNNEAAYQALCALHAMTNKKFLGVKNILEMFYGK